MPNTLKWHKIQKYGAYFLRPNKYYGKLLLIYAPWNVYAYNLTDIYKLENFISDNLIIFENHTSKHFTNTNKTIGV